MMWADYQIQNLDNDLYSSIGSIQEMECSRLLLEWTVDNPHLKSEVFENEVTIEGKKFYRFSMASTDLDGNRYHGFGRSKNRLTAASISAGEVIERYIAKKILRSRSPLVAKHEVHIQDSETSVRQSETQNLPSPGFHSSNGWAVHFSLKKAIENSALESLERHILLYSFLRNGWCGFQEDAEVQFKNQKLVPYLSCFAFGGFSAGMVVTTGREFAGRTFGYLCDMAEKINSSEKWSNAFFESYGQWESLTQTNGKEPEANWLSKYQHHFLNTPHEKCLKEFGSVNTVSDSLRCSVLMLDLKKALGLSFPLFASYTFGGDLIPLFFKQKLSTEEVSSLEQVLKYWNLPVELPEYHPIL